MSKTPKKEKNKSQTYGAVKTLPCVMCPQCKHYEYNEVYAHKHKCKETKSYESSLKIGQNPETDGTAMECGVFEPK